DDAGPDTVGTLDFLRPHAAEPGTPIFELTSVSFFAPMLNGGAHGITEENCVTRVANHLVKSVDVFLSAENQLVDRFSQLFELVWCENARRLGALGINPVLFRRALPRTRYLLDPAYGGLAFCYQMDVISVPRGHVDHPARTKASDHPKCLDLT